MAPYGAIHHDLASLFIHSLEKITQAHCRVLAMYLFWFGFLTSKTSQLYQAESRARDSWLVLYTFMLH